MKPKVIITGGSGMIGSRIVELLGDEMEFIIPTRAELNITDESSVRSFFASVSFDYCLHLAGYTNVDKAEEEPEAAYLLNGLSTRYISTTVDQKKKKFIYVSTDFVFDGKKPPFDEISAKNPISIYGKSKAQGEDFVANSGMIVRVSYPYRSLFTLKNDFVRTILKLLREGKELSLVHDSLMTPTFIDDIASGIRFLINNWSPEIFHLVGSSSHSPFDCAVLIAETFGLDANLLKQTSYDVFFAGRAARPQFSQIVNTKLSTLELSSFEAGLSRMKRQMG